MPRRSRRLVGCLIKAPLGCAAFLLGAGVVAVLFMPAACGPGIARAVEEDFARAHRGRLAIGHASLPGVLEAQELSGVVLSDPEGREVLRGSLRLPSLLDLLTAEEGRSLSGGRLDLSSVDLVRGPGGRSNLRRALARRPRARGGEREIRLRASPDRLELSLGSSPSPLVLGGDASFSLGVTVDHLSWSCAGGDPAERLLLRDVRGSLLVSPAEGGARLSGKLDGRIAGGAGGRAELFVELADLDAFLAGEADAPARLDWRLRRCDPAAADALLGMDGRLAARLSAAVDELVLESRRDGGGERVLLRLASPGVDLRVSGRLEGEDVLVVAGEDELALSLAAGGAPARAVVAELLPFLVELEPDPARSEGRLALRASGVRLTRDGPLAGSFEVILAPGTWRFPAAWRRRAEAAGLSLEGRRALPAGPLRVELEDGRWRWSRLALGEGPDAPVVSGELDRARGELRLEIVFRPAADGVPGRRGVRLEGAVATPSAAPGR